MFTRGYKTDGKTAKKLKISLTFGILSDFQFIANEVGKKGTNAKLDEQLQTLVDMMIVFWEKMDLKLRKINWIWRCPM